MHVDSSGSRRGPYGRSTVGRDTEIGELLRLLDRTGAAVLLEGPAGIGKTHLARALVEAREADGASVVEILGGSSLPNVPLGACAHIVPNLPGEVPLAGLVATTLESLRRRSGETELIILADDLDGLDDGSALLLYHVVREGQIQVLATCRNPAVVPGPLTSLLQEGRMVQSELAPLEHEHVAALAAELAGGELDPASRATVHHITGGNPLWVNELLRAAVARQALFPSPEGWELRVPEAMRGLERLLDYRLRSLGANEGDAVNLLAVAGALPVALLELIVGDEAGRSLLRVGLVSVRGRADELMVQLAHPLYRHCVLLGLDALEVRSILRRLIAASEARTETPRTKLVRLALWHAELGEPFDPSQLGVAAREVHWGLLDLVRRHLAGEHDDPESSEVGLAAGLDNPEARAAAAYRLAAAAWHEDRTFPNGIALARSLATYRPELAAEMVRVLDALRELASCSEERAWLAMCHAQWLFWTVGDREGAVAELSRARLGVEHPWVDVVDSLRAGLRLELGYVAEALAVLERIKMDPETPPAAQVVHASPFAAALNLSGRLQEGFDLAESSLEMASALGSDSAVSLLELVISRLWGALCLGRYGEVEAAASTVARLLAETGDNEPRALLAGMEARAIMLDGRPDVAADKVAEAVPWHGTASILGFRPMLHTTRAVALAWCGHVAEARREVTEARRWHVPPRFIDSELDIADATVLAAEGRHDRAARLASASAARSAELGGNYYAFAGAYVALRAGPSARRLSALERHADAVDGPMARLAVSHGRALQRREVSRLVETADEALSCGDRLLALEMLQAAIHLSAGASDAVRNRLQARCANLRSECGGAWSPFVTRSEGAVPLTAREQEIAELAARGWTSAAIADELYLSPRTVESHLYRAFAKLSVSSREELPGALAQRRPA
jgi:DNA-binding CsgD family transcriptional regulator